MRSEAIYQMPVTTRRLMLVTDDFAVNFDYAQGEQAHIFDCLYHLQGLREIVIYRGIC